MGRFPAEFDEEYWYDGEGLNQIKEWVEKGLTDTKICENIGIHKSTFIKWKKKHEKLLTVYKKAKNIIMNDIENALYRSATGYYVKEDALDRNGNVVQLERYIAPDSRALMWASKNWDPNNYKDKRDVDLSGALPIILIGEDDLKD